MRDYEIVFLVNPDQSDRIKNIIDYFINIINSNDGKIIRMEDWGRRQLAYPINKLHKAHYVMINIKSKQEIINHLDSEFRNNDSIIRHMIIKVNNLNTTSDSPILKICKLDEQKENIK